MLCCGVRGDTGDCSGGGDNAVHEGYGARGRGESISVFMKI